MKVFIIAALTADGYIGRDSHHFPDWTSPVDTQFFVKKTKEAGVIVMGSRTFGTTKSQGRVLPGRRLIVYTSRPKEVIGERVEATQESPERLVKRLSEEGAQGLAICGGTSIYTQFMQAGVVDELFLTVEPILFGSGMPMFNESLKIKLSLLDMTRLGPSVLLLHYAVNK